MEIKLNAGDKINIPENCKAIIEDDLIVIEKREQTEFKDGDILRSVQTGTIVIFKSYQTNLEDNFCSHYNNSNDSNFCWSPVAFRKTTEYEKQKFFDELKAKGLRWNAETKTMEKIRVRVKNGGKYLTINEFGEVAELNDYYSLFDDRKYNSGNYYLPEEREQAEEDAKAIRAIFEKRLKV
jgi:hypothetical protein|nr:MAG TPA: hypothetical protein [Caudoviricetes sp.]